MIRRIIVLTLLAGLLLAPFGAALLQGWDGDLSKLEPEERDGWTLIAMPYPEEMDEWPQWGYDAAGSMLSRAMQASGRPAHCNGSPADTGIDGTAWASRRRRPS